MHSILSVLPEMVLRSTYISAVLRRCDSVFKPRLHENCSSLLEITAFFDFIRLPITSLEGSQTAAAQIFEKGREQRGKGNVLPGSVS